MRAVLLGLLPLVVACSSSSNATPDSTVDAGPRTVTPAACGTRCGTKAKECGAAEAQAGQICASLCASAITEGQATCLDGKSCTDSVSAATKGGTLATICPAAEPAAEDLPGPSSVPAELTVAAGIPSNYVADHSEIGTMRSSLFNVAGPPQVAPAPPAGFLPQVAKSADVTVVSPPRNGCDSVVNVTLSASQLAVSTSGVDILPDAKCAAFIDAIAAQGATLIVRKVPWQGTTETSTVNVVLKRIE